MSLNCGDGPLKPKPNSVGTTAAERKKVEVVENITLTNIFENYQIEISKATEDQTRKLIIRKYARAIAVAHSLYDGNLRVSLTFYVDQFLRHGLVPEVLWDPNILD